MSRWTWAAIQGAIGRGRWAPLLGTGLGVAIFGSAGLVAAMAEGVDWFRWRGPDLNGISTETGWNVSWPSAGPQRLWQANVGIGFSSVAVSQGRVYTLGNRDDQDTVYCFDAATGHVIWRHTYACKLGDKYYEGGAHSTPTVDGHRVYTLSKYGHLHCLEAGTGKVAWSKNLAEEVGAKAPTWGFASAVLTQGDVLYVNVGKAGTALEKATGKVLWKSGPDPAGYATPVPFTLAGKKGLAIFAEQSLVAVDPQTGAQLWEYPWKTRYEVNAADPIFQGDLVFISSGYDHGAALVRITDGQPATVWASKEMRNHYNSCVLLGGHLYGYDQNADLKCLAFETGEVKWTEKKLGKGGQGALMVADGKLIVLSETGELIVAPADPRGFKPISRAKVLGGKCWTTPVLSQGRIYCRNAQGDLVCLDVRGQEVAGR